MTANASTPLEPCPGCGARYAPQDGPTHRYMVSSPACWAAYGEVLAADYSDPERMSTIHHLVVDAFACQHPGSPNAQSVQSVGVHLLTIAMVSEFGADPADALTIRRKTVGTRDFQWLEPPASPDWFTVQDMLAAPEPTAGAYEWVESVWRAWSDHHDTVNGWLRDAGLIP